MEKRLNSKGQIEVRFTADDLDKKVIGTVECDWGYVDVILMTHPEILGDEAIIRWDGLDIINCPKNVEKIDMKKILRAINCFMSVYNTYGSVTFNYPTLEKDMKRCYASC